MCKVDGFTFSKSMITINSKILYNICITIIIQYKFLYDLKLSK